MGLQAADAALVGDSDKDMRTAVNAGLLAVGVTWGYRDRDAIAAAGAAHLIDAPRELLESAGQVFMNPSFACNLPLEATISPIRIARKQFRRGPARVPHPADSLHAPCEAYCCPIPPRVLPRR